MFLPFIIMTDSHLVGIRLVSMCWAMIMMMMIKPRKSLALMWRSPTLTLKLEMFSCSKLLLWFYIIYDCICDHFCHEDFDDFQDCFHDHDQTQARDVQLLQAPFVIQF